MADKKQLQEKQGEIVVKTDPLPDELTHQKFWANPEKTEQRAFQVTTDKRKVIEIKHYEGGAIKRSLKGLVKGKKVILDHGIKMGVLFGGNQK